MDVIKIIGIGFVSLIIAVILKQYKPEFSVYISIICGVLIFFLVSGKIQNTINFIQNISTKTTINTGYIVILIKITGIAILTEFAVSICKDSNENAIANKVDLGGKILIISISMPIMESLIQTITKILP